MFELFESLTKKRSLTIGFTCGTFDFLHAGHVMMLEESKGHCDYLIVGLLSDPTISRPETKNKPVESMWERYVRLQSLKSVDMIVPWDTEEDLINMLEMIRPNIRFVGEEYKDKSFTGKDLGIPIYYNKRTHKYSSTATRQKVEDTPLKRISHMICGHGCMDKQDCLSKTERCPHEFANQEDNTCCGKFSLCDKLSCPLNPSKNKESVFKNIKIPEPGTKKIIFPFPKADSQGLINLGNGTYVQEEALKKAINDFNRKPCMEDSKKPCTCINGKCTEKGCIAYLGPDRFSNGTFSPCVGCNDNCISESDCKIFKE
jgi:glycerol-3-phosphate cytidylyltransferase